ncbi:MAG: outer membrane beta-barrel protein [Bacteroidota bacterium]
MLKGILSTLRSIFETILPFTTPHQLFASAQQIAQRLSEIACCFVVYSLTLFFLPMIYAFRHLSLLFCLTAPILTGFAQVKGEVSGANGEPLAYINVLLLHPPDSSLIQGTTTDDLGQFAFSDLAQGTYLLGLSAIGYSDWHSPPFELSKEHLIKDFGSILFQEAAIELEGVEVKAQRMLFQQNKEGTTINVQSSVMTKGSSALQVLERSPGVFIDRRNENISLSGQNGVRIMLNGKMLRLSVSEVLVMLDGMSADNIEKIELLTSPSAKYDAEGGAGIINIVLKKQEDMGTQGSFSLSEGYGEFAKSAVSFQLNRRRASTNTYASYAYNYDQTYYDWSALGDEHVPLLGGDVRFDVLYTSQLKKQSHNLQLGFDQDLNKDSRVGASLQGIRSRQQANNFNDTEYWILPDSFLFSDIQITSDDQWTNALANGYWEQRFKNEGSLKLNADYLYFQNENPNQASSVYHNRLGEVIYPEGEIYANENRGVSETKVHIGVLAMDYERALSPRLKLESGWKVTYAQTDNIGQIERWDQDEWVIDDRSMNTGGLEERIAAGYVSMDSQLDSTWSLTAGLRYAFWDQQFSNEENNRRLGHLFPSLFLSKKLSANRQIRLSYTKRITRPDYNDLASFLTYNGPISVFTGNPQLQPNISHALRLSYQYQGYQLSFQFQHDNGPIARYQIIENEQGNQVLISPQNVDAQRSYQLQFDAPLHVQNWWTANIGATGAWRQFELSYTQTPVQHDYLTFSLYGSQTFQLPKEFSLELSGWYTGAHYDGSRLNDGFGMLNAGLRKSLKNNWGTLQLSITDLFRSMKITSHIGTLTREAFDAKADVLFHAESAVSRIFRLSYSRSFGNKKVQSRKRNGENAAEERSRIRQD